MTITRYKDGFVAIANDPEAGCEPDKYDIVVPLEIILCLCQV
jgi:hypothetical protein